MDTFLENFEEFRAWMYNSLKNEDNPTIKDVVDKFKSLNLDEVF